MIHTRRHFAGRLLAFGLGTPVALATGVNAWADDDDSGLPNTFISPSGKPFRAPSGTPYPVATWFKSTDKNGDGRVDRDEFVAEADAFFTLLDFKKREVLGPLEIAFYEQRIAPEILGAGLPLSLAAPISGRWILAQFDKPAPIDPNGGDGLQPNIPRPKDFDESNQGASPYSLFQEPEPIMAADLDLNGFIRRANFLKLADMHFTNLDANGDGYLTLAKLPKTPIQKLLEKNQPKHRKS